jgi:hypothetical protein
MDADILKGTSKKGNQLIILPDADISENETESESEGEYIQQCESGNSTVEESEVESEEDIQFAQVTPLSKPIKFNWDKNAQVASNSEYLLQFPDPPFPRKSPIEYFLEFFSNELIQEITEQTRLYAAQNDKTNFQLSNDEMKQFLGVILLMGIVQMPDYKMYWADGSRFPFIADLLPKTRFYEILSNLHFNNNNNAILDRNNSKCDRLFKIRPVLESIQSKCRSIDPEEKYYIDEQIIPFKARNTITQYLPKKPHKWGLKLFVRCGLSGITYDFSFYKGKDPEIEANIIPQALQFQAAKFVWKLLDGLPDNQNFKIYFNDYFNSLELQAALIRRGIHSIGTIRANRLRGCILKSEAELKREGRGAVDSCFDTKNSIYVVRWYDRRAITLSSTYSSIEPKRTCIRWNKLDKSQIELSCPNIVQENNSYKSRVDLFNMLNGLCRIDHGGKKWYRRVFFWALNLCTVNAWLLHRRHYNQYGAAGRKSASFRDFVLEISVCLRKSGQIFQEIPIKRGRPSRFFVTPTTASTASIATEELEPDHKEIISKSGPNVQDPIWGSRFDNIGHLPEHVEKKNRCRLCSGIVRTKCAKCNEFLCLTKKRNCYRDYHTQQIL